MKAISELTVEYTTDWYAGACKEIFHFKTRGLWPTHCPYMNDFRNNLIAEGYPCSQVQNIAIDCVMMFAVGALPAIWEAYLEKK